jgi:hypothetical protein
MDEIDEKIRLKKELYRQKSALLESPDLQKKISDYRYWSKQLPILKKEIEDIIDEPLDGLADIPSPSKRGRKKGNAPVSEGDVKEELITHLQGMTKGKSARQISRDLHTKDRLRQVPESTIYKKVADLLKAGEGTEFGKTGQLKNTEWFLLQK